MILFYIIQFLAIQFAIAVARHDGPAVSHFEEFGFRSDQEMKSDLRKFHHSNGWLKFFFCVAAAVPAVPDWEDVIANGLVSFLWIYLLFDPVLNGNRAKKRPWYYLGEHDGHGSFWMKLFGEKAGKIKAVILFTMIVAVNILYPYV